MKHTFQNIEKVAAFLLAFPSEDTSQVLSFFEEEEIKEVSRAMTRLNFVDQPTLGSIFKKFIEDFNRGSALIASDSKIRTLLEEALGKDKCQEILERIHKPNITTWDRLEKAPEGMLGAFLQNERPQTIATILLKLSNQQASKVLSTFPDTLSATVLERMLSGSSAKREIVDKIEASIRRELMAELGRTTRAQNPYERVAEIFNGFDRSTELRMLEKLATLNPQAKDRIRALMFTFEDLVRIDNTGTQILIREADKGILALALKGAPEPVSTHIFSNMTERAGKLLKEDIAALGAVRMKEVEEAQSKIITLIRELKEGGSIVVREKHEEEVLVE